METECNTDTRISLYNLASRLYKRVVRTQDVIKALNQQWNEDEKDLHRILDEQNELRGAHIRFMNLEEEAKRKMARLRRLAVLLGQQGDFDPAEKAAKVGLDVDPGFDEIALWEAIAELIRHTPEIRIVDLHLLLRELYDKKLSRQAVDSALETHSELFKIRRSGREKFVSLK